MMTFGSTPSVWVQAKAAAAFDLKTALDGKAEWWKVRRAVLDFVNAD